MVSYLARPDSRAVLRVRHVSPSSFLHFTFSWRYRPHRVTLKIKGEMSVGDYGLTGPLNVGGLCPIGTLLWSYVKRWMQLAKCSESGNHELKIIIKKSRNINDPPQPAKGWNKPFRHYYYIIWHYYIIIIVSFILWRLKNSHPPKYMAGLCQLPLYCLFKVKVQMPAQGYWEWPR